MKKHHHHSHEGHEGCCGGHHHKEEKETAAAETTQEGETHTHSGDCCGHDHDHDHHHQHGHDHGHDCCGHGHHHHHGHDDTGDAVWTRKFFAFLQGVVLLMIGGVMCYFVASGRIDGAHADLPYVTGWFKVLVLCGGLGIMVMGVFNWLMRNRVVDCGHDHGTDNTGDCGHDHGGKAHVHSHDGTVLGRAITLLLLSGSVATATLLTPDQLSPGYLQHKANAYQNDRGSMGGLDRASPELAAARGSQGGLTLEKIEQYQKRTKDGDFPLSVMSLHYMSADPEYADVMEGQPVETTGQIVKDAINPGPGNLRAVTMQVTCCAADARPYSVPVVFEGAAPEFVEMGWYTIKGKLEFTRERGMKMAVVKAKSLTATMRPDDSRTVF